MEGTNEWMNEWIGCCLGNRQGSGQTTANIYVCTRQTHHMFALCQPEPQRQPWGEGLGWPVEQRGGVEREGWMWGMVLAGTVGACATLTKLPFQVPWPLASCVGPAPTQPPVPSPPFPTFQTHTTSFICPLNPTLAKKSLLSVSSCLVSFYACFCLSLWSYEPCFCLFILSTQNKLWHFKSEASYTWLVSCGFW